MTASVKREHHLRLAEQVAKFRHNGKRHDDALGNRPRRRVQIDHHVAVHVPADHHWMSADETVKPVAQAFQSIDVCNQVSRCASALVQRKHHTPRRVQHHTFSPRPLGSVSDTAHCDNQYLHSFQSSVTEQRRFHSYTFARHALRQINIASAITPATKINPINSIIRASSRTRTLGAEVLRTPIFISCGELADQALRNVSDRFKFQTRPMLMVLWTAAAAFLIRTLTGGECLRPQLIGRRPFHFQAVAMNATIAMFIVTAIAARQIIFHSVIG